MSVTEVPVTENRKAWNYVTPKILSTISSSKPIFDNKYNNAYFYKHQAINDIDKSIYKIQEHRRNIYFSNFAIIYNGNNYGVINKENKIIVPYEYEYIALTRFGLLVRNKNQENFFIDLKNNFFVFFLFIFVFFFLFFLGPRPPPPPLPGTPRPCPWHPHTVPDGTPRPCPWHPQTVPLAPPYRAR